MDLKKIGMNTRNWIDSDQDRDYCECGIEPLLEWYVVQKNFLHYSTVASNSQVDVEIK